MEKPKIVTILFFVSLLIGGTTHALEPKGVVPTVVKMKAPWSLTYHDGSANAFRFWQDSKEGEIRFEYDPVRPEESSTGTYSGGEPKIGSVDDPGAQELWRWVRRFQSDTALHVGDRMKGTGDFYLKIGEAKDHFIVKDGPLLRQFNEFVATLRDKIKSDLQWQGPFPIYPGAVKDPAKGGATTLPPGRNFTLSVYTTDKPLAEVLRFYETHLKNFKRSEDPDGTVTLKIAAGSVRIKAVGPKTRIQITQGLI